MKSLEQLFLPDFQMADIPDDKLNSVKKQEHADEAKTIINNVVESVAKNGTNLKMVDFGDDDDPIAKQLEVEKKMKKELQ